ncbi:helix-turn-helix domain-containing protein [Salmonella enterica]|nr:helix-turn-helix domain-containing protein [Salmonella enterica]EBH8947238.1 DNA-binding protein [Salmonella enterica subsp. diarizonae serovar 48:i:z]EBU8670242.1 DNA-binding protein [Salmonella enterica subsp. enterica serovar Panama]ECF2802286.1 DNA-binding protein [Salmonella enterica subsp. enterica serovar Miami]EHE7039207.1 helix-turn-helix domain-containing protein [Salmonella enterica subsp. enterica serovar Newport]EHJ5404084.1 helix-turn-helix domain-containing protein [Salmonell
MKQYTFPQINHSAADPQLTALAEVINQIGISTEELSMRLLHDNALRDAFLRPTQNGYKNNSANAKDQGFIGTAEVALKLGVKKQTLLKWICNDTLPPNFPRPFKVNRRNKWRIKDVNAYFVNLTNEI